MRGLVVQLNENHKWCGCLAIMFESEPDIDRYLVGVPVPEMGTAYIFVNRKDFDFIGDAILMPGD